MLIPFFIFFAGSFLSKHLRWSFAQSLPLAFCLVTVFFAVTLPALSVFHLVTPLVVRLLAAGVLFHFIRTVSLRELLEKLRAYVSTLISDFKAQKVGYKLFYGSFTALVLMILGNAVLFPPSNWDSMTYHMTRVAFWVQNQSVFPYPTANPRQFQMTPGAEYLILVEQLFWMSDRFANLIQFVAFGSVVAGSFSWLEKWGVDGFRAFALVAMFALAPMAILQAQTTQNDLAASVPVVAAGIFFVDRYLVGSPNNRSISTAMVAIIWAVVLSASYMIKPTGLLVLAPFVLYSLAYELIGNKARSLDKFRALAVFALIGLAACLPEMFQKMRHGSSLSRGEVNLGFGDPVAQLFNGIRHIVDHIHPAIAVPVVTKIANVLNVDPQIITRTGVIYHPNEDTMGNPVQFITALIVLAVIMFRPRRQFFALGLMLVLSWFFLHAIVVNQTWMSRLQTPWFYILIPTLGYYLAKNNLNRKATYVLASLSIAVAVFTQTWVTASRLKESQWSLPLSESSRHDAYYYRRPYDRFSFAKLNQLIDRCEVLALISRDDDYDYPLVWRTILRGKSINYYFGEKQTGGCYIDPRQHSNG